MHFWYGGWGVWAWMLPMMVIWLVLAGLAVWGVLRASTRREDDATSRTGAPPETAQAIVDRRLASGEIDLETHRRLRAAIAGDDEGADRTRDPVAPRP
jgi:putative membrane protein